MFQLTEKEYKVVFDAIRELMTPPDPKRKPIGFTAEMEDS
jgi:hypothetical protein